MSFINEYIPKEDLEKYNFAELNKHRKIDVRTARQWTVDRENHIWLRHFYTQSDHTELDGGFTGVSAWDFYWKGSLMMVEIKGLEAGGGVGEHCWARKKLLSINIPPNLESQRIQILKDLEETVAAYKDGGVLSSCTSYTLTFDI